MSFMGLNLSGHGWPPAGGETGKSEIIAVLKAGAGGVVLADVLGVGKTRLAREVPARAQQTVRDIDYVVATRAAYPAAQGAPTGAA